MEEPHESPAEVRRLQRCISDLVGVLALPASWGGGEPLQIANTLGEALLGMLHLDLVYVKLNASTGRAPLEAVRSAPWREPVPQLDEVTRELRSVRDQPQPWPAVMRKPFGNGEISIVPLPLGLQGEIGVVAAGSERADFPDQMEKLLLSIAANQAVIGLQQAQLLSEQRRKTTELGGRVAQRTRELARAGEELHREIDRRRNVEEKLSQEEKELRASQIRSKAILDSALDCLVAIDHEARITEFNPAAERTFGYLRAEVIGRPLAEVLVPPSLRKDYQQGFARYLAGGEAPVLGRRLEMTALRADGSEIPVELSITQILLPGPPSFTGCLRDISERRRSEDALRKAYAQAARSEERWRSVFENSAVGVALTDLSGQFLAANPVYLQMLGYTEQELQSLSFLDITVEKYLESNRQLVGELIAGTRREFQIEKQYRRRDGSLVWVRNQVSLVPGTEREPRFLMAIVEDISERKRAEDALRASERDLAAIINAIPTTAWSTRPDGYCDFLNQRWLDYAGMSAEQAQGWGWGAAIHPHDRERLVAYWQSCLASGTPVDTEARVRRFDGAYRWFLFRANPLRDASGAIVRWYGTNIDIEDRRRAEEALRTSELSLRQIIDSVPGFVVTMSGLGQVELVNRQTLDYFAHTVEELEKWALIGAVHPDDLPRVIAVFTRSIETGQIYDIEHRCRRADGVYRWFQVRGLPVRDAQGTVTRWYLLLTDIHDRKLAEEALLANERDLHLIINTIPALAWSAGPNGVVDFLNRRWLDYTGLSVEHARGWNWTVAVHPDDVNALADQWRSIMASGETGEIEARLRRFDGEYRWFLFRASAVRNESGTIVKWYGTNTDIDDRRRAEEQLRRSEAFLAEAQHLTRIGSFSWRVATGQFTCSEQLYRIFEFEPAVPVTLNLIRGRVHPDDLPLMNDMIAQAQRAVSDFEYEYRLLMPDASTRYLHLIAHALRSQQGWLEYIGAVQDVTQRQLGEAALASARAELAHVTRVTSLGVLTASIAHEVNQPLSGIVTNASTCLRMLNADPPNVDGARETARRTIRDGNRASEVIARLRTLFNQKEIAAEALDLNDAAREVITLSLNEWQRNRVILRQELADDLPPIHGDRVQLQQVILNLLRNGSDAMAAVEGRPRELLVRTERDEKNRVRLSVKDAGVGFDPQLADRLFERFYTTKSDGMGIGLSISRSIVEAHEGHLWAALNDGPGSTFVFSLPCAGEVRAADDPGLQQSLARPVEIDTKVQ